MRKFPRKITDASRDKPLDYRGFKIVEESLYSSLLPRHMDQVMSAISKHVKYPKTIIDATANIGVDTALVAYMFPDSKITSIELNKKTAKVLQDNMRRLEKIVRGQEYAKVAVVQGDSVKFLRDKKTPVDLVYFDPPWGGSDYYKTPKLVLKLSDIPIGKIIASTLGNLTPMVILKAPSNMDMEEFMTHFGKVKITGHDILKPRKNERGAIAYRLYFITPAES